MKQMDANSGLIAGAISIAVFLVCVFLLNVSVLLSIVPAAIACVAVLVLVGSGNKPTSERSSEPTAEERKAMAEGAQKVEHLRQLADELPTTGDTRGRQQVFAIADKAAKILNAIRQDPNKHEAAAAYLTGYLTPIDGWVTRYALLKSRNVESAKPALDKAETETLRDIQRSLDELFDQLHVNDLAKLMAGNAVMELTFKPIEIKPEE